MGKIASPRELAHSCETGSVPPDPKPHTKGTHQGKSHPLRCLAIMHSKERDPILSLITQWVQDEVDFFFFNPMTATPEEAYFTEQKILFPKCRDAICVTSVFHLHESILFLQLNYKPLRSEPQWIFLQIPHNCYCVLVILGAPYFCCVQLYYQKTMPIIS